MLVGCICLSLVTVHAADVSALPDETEDGYVDAGTSLESDPKPIGQVKSIDKRMGNVLEDRTSFLGYFVLRLTIWHWKLEVY